MVENDFSIVVDRRWPGNSLDPYIRLAVVLMETDGCARLRHRAGQTTAGRQILPLLAELNLTKHGTPVLPRGLKIPRAYVESGARYVTGTIDVHSPRELRKQITALRRQVKRLKLALPNHAHLAESLKDIKSTDLPQVPRYPGVPNSRQLDGTGVIIGIIDDGCAFAHPNFLAGAGGANPASRVRYLWDQSAARKKSSSGWSVPADFQYGAELKQRSIDRVIAANTCAGIVDQAAVYGRVDYKMDGISTHGTHVMDIAAGNGRLPAGPGVAPGADIIFVQLPKAAIENAEDSVLSRHFLDGLIYIFSRARREGKSAVVNISYGGYAGPHDGTSVFERAVDELLDKKDLKLKERHLNRAVVISAGNGFDKRCHAQGRLAAAKSKVLNWRINPDDPTLNMLEVWYGADAELEIGLIPPGASHPLRAVALGESAAIRGKDRKAIGWVFHRRNDSGNGDNHVLIALRATSQDAGVASLRSAAPAPYGTWGIKLTNVARSTCEFHAWIERDDSGGLGDDGARQSCFVPADASPECTIASFASGEHTICVGGYNVATQEVSAYSACGPTRASSSSRARTKPDVCAPAEEQGTETGILSASASSGQPTRMNGTSAAAPFVAGAVAQIFQVAGQVDMPAQAVRKALAQGAQASPNVLRPNLRQALESKDRADRQTQLLALRTGAGKINLSATAMLVHDSLAYIPKPPRARTRR